IYQDVGKSVGDASLREFRGTLSQFETPETLENLLDSAGDAEVARLIRRLDLPRKLSSFEVHGIFLTNVDVDANGTAFLRTEPRITLVGRSGLAATYVSDERAVLRTRPITLDVAGIPVAKYIVDSSTRALIAPIMARELVTLQGIADQSVFAFNVRGPLGRTQVNRDIITSIRDSSKHKLFPLFHNGITVIAEKVQDTDDRITIENYYVVNGCQSLSALYDNREALTDSLRILTKILEMDVRSGLSAMVTHYSNNQNGVRARDFKSNNPIQIRLQNEFRSQYAGQYEYEIKRGEHLGAGEVISNEIAGLYIMAVDLTEPWATHRKYQVFEEKHADLFGRPEVTAHRIVFYHLLAKSIDESSSGLDNKLLGKYALTRYVILYMVCQVLRDDETGRAALASPKDFVLDLRKRTRIQSCIKRVIGDMIVDINHEVEEYGEDFDYRGRLRDAEWVKNLSREVVGSYKKLVRRKRIPSLHSEWTNSSA
ncbi:MAG: AIPR family protein, partial [Candidatus Krumholzibacteria bacterium]|nr:AIPR family protein [Candidatus Krumholzibacteria bacterium]